MTRRRAWCLVMLWLAAAGCGGGNPPQSPGPAPDTGETITGRERIGWDQVAADTAELGTLRFAMYVDGSRNELADSSCTPVAGVNGFPCSARLPALTPGTHLLEIAAFPQGSPELESPRSTSFRVTVIAAVPDVGAASSWVTGEAGTTADGVRLRLELVAEGVQHPTDAVFAPDGRLFIAERAGRIRVVRGGVLQPAPALQLSGIAPGGGLLALALAPDFADSGHVFTLSTAITLRGPIFRLERYRELRGMLAQRAVLLESPAQVPSAAMRFGPDGLLYIALGAQLPDAPSAYSGKVLRLMPDGRAPRDRRAGMPAISSGHGDPRALAWRAGSPWLWIADGVPGGAEWIAGLPLEDGLEAPPAWGLPAGAATSGMTFYESERIPAFRGDLFIASATARRLLRITFGDDPAQATASESLLDQTVGPIRTVTAGPDGALYFCTDTAIGRLSAAEPGPVSLSGSSRTSGR